MGLLIRLLCWCPGAVGILLRQKFYPGLLGSCGRGVLFGRFIDLVHAKNIHIGDNAVLSSRCRLTAGSEASRSITIGGDVFIGIGTLLHAEGGAIVVRQGANLGSECRVVAGNPLTIGQDVLMAAFCVVGEETSARGESGHSDTRIGDNVWLGARSRVASGVHVGDEAILGAHAGAGNDINAYGIAVGDPAAVVRFRK